jgi:hypothetical protein
VVLLGGAMGVGLTPLVAALDVGSHYRLPYRKMLVFTAQALTVVFVIGSYLAAEHVQVRRPRRRTGALAPHASHTPS